MNLKKIYIISLFICLNCKLFCAQNDDKYFIVLNDSAKIIQDSPMKMEVELVLYSEMKAYSYIRKVELKALSTNLKTFKENRSEIKLNGRTYILYIKTQKTLEDFINNYRASIIAIP